MLKAIIFLIIVWHGLMLGCVLIHSTTDSADFGTVVKAVVLHDRKFLAMNCEYKKARILCVTLFLLINLLGSISTHIL